MIQSILVIAILLLCLGGVIRLWVLAARRGGLQEILLLIGEALSLASGGVGSVRER